MTFSFIEVSLLVVGYLSVLFTIALATDRGLVPSKIINSPITFTLSLGVFASAWAYYGVLDLAYQYGYGVLAYYLGACALFLFAPLIIQPIALLASRFQISNLADLMVFRFHSHAAGKLTAVCMLMVFLPLVALQLQAVADTLQIMTESGSADLPDYIDTPLNSRELLALTYCLVLALFTIAFGSNRERAPGLMVAMAFDSLIKVIALFAIGLLSVYGIFGGFSGLDQWLQMHPEHLDSLHTPVTNNSSHTLVLVFLASSIAMPHIFQISAAEGRVRQAAGTVSWGFPLMFLLMALPVFPILWAGFATELALPAQYFPLGVPMQSSSVALTLLAFIGGLSAASGAMITLSLALATMLLNQWLVPTGRIGRRNFLSQLSLLRSVIIASMFALGFIFYKVLDSNLSLTDLALMGFIEALQFLPSVLAISYWSMANSKGYITGLSLGTLIWLVGLILPTLTNVHSLDLDLLNLSIPLGIDYWSEITITSFCVNVAALILVSMFTEASVEERYSADLCAEDELSHPLRMILDIHSAHQFIDRLSERLGLSLAQKEVQKALHDLGLSDNERRPYALRRLRDKLEANLSGLVGTAVANEIMDKQIPYHLPEESRSNADINMIENRLSQYRSHLTGLAAELNNLRLYHRNTVEELPLAACSLGDENEILLWNHAIEQLTGITAEQVVGSYLNALHGPWMNLLNDFSHSPHQHLHKQQVDVNGQSHWINLHKAALHGTAADIADGQIILLEDVTDLQLLEQELVHTERLASIGRLAAGVAHEIGNPITGIDCLAQNLKYEADDAGAVQETAKQILSQTDRVTRIVQSLVSFSHGGNTTSSDFMRVRVRDCVEEAIHLLNLQKEQRQVNFVNHVDPDLELQADPQKLIQIFINLLSNSRDASEEEDQVSVTSQLDQNYAVLSVTDEGTGIPQEHLDRVLEPFYTTKDIGKGTGLGLAMVYNIVDEHQGQVDISSPPPQAERGTRISIKLPLMLE